MQRPFVRSNPPFAAFRWSALKSIAIMARVFEAARVPEILGPYTDPSRSSRFEATAARSQDA
jgi:hypothetical protein